MTKEELIALSDLNREDNIKYISSEAQGIAIALDSERYAPALCKLERAYICGRRKSEDYIADLEKENADLKMGLKRDADNRDELLKENAELKKQQFTLRNERNTFLAQNEQYEKDLIDFNEELATAKEIIKELLDFDFLPENEIKKQAEHFLEECQ